MNSLPFPDPAVRFHRAAVQLHQSLHQSEADAQARPANGRADRSACVNISKICGSSSGPIPMPVSRTPQHPSLPQAHARADTRPPSFVYLAALLSRLTSTCPRRAGSAISHTARSAALHDQRVPAVLMIGPHGLARHASTTSREVTTLLPSRICPVVMRETSSRSSTHMLEIAELGARGSRATCCWIPFSLSFCSRSSSTALSIEASGLRSSWLSIARNSSFRRSRSDSSSPLRLRASSPSGCAR